MHIHDICSLWCVAVVNSQELYSLLSSSYTCFRACHIWGSQCSFRFCSQCHAACMNHGACCSCAKHPRTLQTCPQCCLSGNFTIALVVLLQLPTIDCLLNFLGVVPWVFTCDSVCLFCFLKNVCADPSQLVRLSRATSISTWSAAAHDLPYIV